MKTLSFKNQKNLDLLSYLLTALFVSFVFLSIVMPPSFSFEIPLTSEGRDELCALSILKMIAQKDWIPFTNLSTPYLSTPEGFDMGDFPMSDYFHFILIKIISFFSQSPALIYNVFYFLTFLLAAWTAAFALRTFRISRWFAFPLGVLYAFMPYHHYRYDHLFLCGYYMLPLMTILLIWTCSAKPLFFKLHSVTKKMQWDFSSKKPRFALVTLMIAGGCGVYYCFFFLWLMAGAGISGWIYRKSRYHFYSACIACGICLGFLALGNTSYLYYTLKNGTNPRNISQRHHRESEIWALKLSHMMLPPKDHRIDFLAHHKKKYKPLISCEGVDESLGTILTLTFLFLLGYFLFGNRRSALLRRLSSLTLTAILYGSTGGFSVLFALLIYPRIRSHNRISIFIAFFVIFTLSSILQHLLQQGKLRSLSSKLILLGLFIFSIYDQTIPYSSDLLLKNQLQYERDASFVQKIETLYPQSKILQLPYLWFPESNYAHLIGFLHSQNLYWSYGGMPGRNNDLLYSQLSKKPMSLKAIQEAGFQGIWINRKIYQNYRDTNHSYLKDYPSVEEVEAQLHAELHETPLSNQEGSIVYYPFQK